MDKEKYVKVCPNCGSTNISLNAELTNLASGMSNLTGNYCLDCKFSGIFPEMTLSNADKFATKVSNKSVKEFSNENQAHDQQVFYAETKKERSFYYVNKFFGKRQKIYWIIVSIITFVFSVYFYISGDNMLGSVILFLAIFSSIINYGMYRESSKYAERGAYK